MTTASFPIKIPDQVFRLALVRPDLCKAQNDNTWKFLVKGLKDKFGHQIHPRIEIFTDRLETNQPGHPMNTRVVADLLRNNIGAIRIQATIDKPNFNQLDRAGQNAARTTANQKLAKLGPNVVNNHAYSIVIAQESDEHQVAEMLDLMPLRKGKVFSLIDCARAGARTLGEYLAKAEIKPARSYRTEESKPVLVDVPRLRERASDPELLDYICKVIEFNKPNEEVLAA